MHPTIRILEPVKGLYSPDVPENSAMHLLHLLCTREVKVGKSAIMFVAGERLVLSRLC